jgi:regulator of RNase E activity RraB
MTPATVSELRQHGVTDQRQLKLEYFFYTNTREKAAALAQKLGELGYTSSHDRAAGNKKQFVVTGWTSPMQMDERIVLAWTGRMCELGQEHDCEFDGWGTNPTQP